MFHIEMRQFPHNACVFNLSEPELLRFVEPWSREQWIELGERKWNPHQARMTVLEGPHLPVGELSMGRGWRNAQRRSQDVTERVLARARASQQAVGAASAEGPAQSTQGAGPGEPAVAGAATAADAQLRPLLGADPAALLQAWQLAAQRRPELSPSESLALAERTLQTLDS